MKSMHLVMRINLIQLDRITKQVDVGEAKDEIQIQQNNRNAIGDGQRTHPCWSVQWIIILREILPLPLMVWEMGALKQFGVALPFATKFIRPLLIIVSALFV
jgi:hypothetical protein